MLEAADDIQPLQAIQISADEGGYFFWSRAIHASGYDRCVVANGLNIGYRGQIEVNAKLIEGALHLPFGWTGVFGTVNLQGHLSDTELALSGSTGINIGTFVLAGAALAITHTGLTVTGTWLNQSIVFSAYKANDLLLFQAAVAPITVSNVITITGSSPQGGPAATLGLNAGNVPYVSLDGTIKLPLIQSQGAGLFQINSQRFSFGITSKLFGSTFGATLSVTGTNIQNAATFSISASVDSTLLQYLEQSTISLLDSQLQAVSGQLEPLRQQLQSANQKFSEANSALNIARDLAQQKIDAAEREVEMQRQAIQIVQQKINQAGFDLVTKYLLEQELKVYEKALDEATRTLQKVRRDVVNTIIIPAQQALDLAQKALGEAQLALASFEQAHQAVVNILNYVAEHTLAGLLIVSSASFTAQYSAISNGYIPSLTINLTYMGRTLPQQIDFDFSHPQLAGQALANKLLALV